MERKFKVGDRVVCVKSVDDNTSIVGQTGEVIAYDGLRAGVCFDTEIDFGHSLGGLVEGIRGWWCEEYALEPEDDPCEQFSAPEPFWP